MGATQPSLARLFYMYVCLVGRSGAHHTYAHVWKLRKCLCTLCPRLCSQAIDTAMLFFYLRWIRLHTNTRSKRATHTCRELFGRLCVQQVYACSAVRCVCSVYFSSGCKCWKTAQDTITGWLEICSQLFDG